MNPASRPSLLFLFLLVCLLEQSLGAQVAQESQRGEDKFLNQFFADHCQKCHSGTKPKGEFDLSQLTDGFGSKSSREHWSNVLDQLEAENMPPSDSPQPDQKIVKKVIERIRTEISQAEKRARAKNGRVVLRRLNRNEYVNTIQDLFGVKVDLSDLFPESHSVSGFDNDAQSLHLSTHLLNNYLAAADRVIDAAIANGPRPQTRKIRLDIKDEKSIRPTGSVYRHVKDGVAVFATAVNANIQVTLWRFNTREPGKYRFRISGYAYQSDKPVYFHVKSGPMNAAAQQDLIDYFEFKPLPSNSGKPTVVEFAPQMKSIHTLRIVADGLKVRTRDVERIGADKYEGPGIVIQHVEVEGPLIEQWPPKGHVQLFGDLPRQRNAQDRNRLEVVSDQPLEDAKKILKSFCRRAFRRSVTDKDIQPYIARVVKKLDEGNSFESAVRVGLKSVLVAPDFLFLRENRNENQKGNQLDDFALASRLSYFLWSSMPDEELLKLAEKKQLGKKNVLAEQVERLLDDPKSGSFVDHFLGQWLALRSIDDTMPDRQLYPEFDDLLKESMVEEVTGFFQELLNHDLSLANLIDSDFSMLNSRLAKHYGLNDVEGIRFRKVRLPENSKRGGILTMAAIMKVTANGTTTSPILRGTWVLDRLLGSPPPKPTVDIEAIEPDIRGATTIRSQLAKHRDLPSCATCHSKIDPHGFALENFDVIGGWRESYRSIGRGEPVIVDGRNMRYRNGPPVQSNDKLLDGREFKNIQQYKKILLEDLDQVATSVAEKLVSYSTGAAVATMDQDSIDQIVTNARKKNYGLRSLIHEVVKSELFRNK